MTIQKSFYTLTFADNTVKSGGQPEHSVLEIAMLGLDDDGSDLATLALLGTWEIAVDAVSIGNIVQKNIILNRDKLADTPASSPLAQRENKFLCRYHNPTSGKKLRASIPCADLSLLANNSEFLVLSSGPGQTLKNAWAAVVVDPDDPTTLTVLDSVQFVGRNT